MGLTFLFASGFVQDPNSGAAGSISAIGKALTQRGHQVDYLWLEKRPYRLPHPSLSRLLELPRRQFKQMTRKLAATTYDVVIISQPYAYLVYEELAPRYPHTLFLNRTHGWESRLDAASRQFQWREDLNPLSNFGTRLSSIFMERICARTARACHGLIVPSSLCAKFIAKNHQISPEKLAVIPYGVDREFLEQTVATRMAAPTLGLLFVGNYIPLKGKRLMESALPEIGRQYPDTRLTFVVPQGSVASVRACYAPSYGNRLTVHGWMARRDLIRIYAAHDLLLFASLFEGFGKTFLEAMACGLCVVGYDQGGISDLAQNGQEALFCATGDEVAFRNLLVQCLREPGLPQVIGQRAQQLASHYPWDRNASQTEQFCLRLMHNRKT